MDARQDVREVDAQEPARTRSVAAKMARMGLIALLLVATVAIFLTRGGPTSFSAAEESEFQTTTLTEPAFLRTAYAETDSALSTIADEAGIAAYFKTNMPVDLAKIAPLYRTIELRTDDYIIGSIPVPGHNQEHDMKVYVHRDGWFLAYYFVDDPVGKIIDWTKTTASNIVTKFEVVLPLVADATAINAPALSYYDFRYPNATDILFVYENVTDGSSFRIRMPGEYAYYTRSYSVHRNSSSRGSALMSVNGSNLPGCGSSYYVCTYYGDITATLLPPNTFHTIEVSWFGVLILVYRAQ